ncbi:glutaminase A [uncultured Sphingomonas sp.]|uniref:glutaminase A n=1 Tax=unclassified Sphingomonas TaxID=196159 RepID=UPI0025F3DD93|nr:glutaminase A [uncultured Sphingomonas sp.]
MDLQIIVNEIAREIEEDAAQLEAAADAKREGLTPGQFGMAVAIAEDVFTAGAADVAFPIQSISKVLALELALCSRGDRIFERVGREPSGDPFNSVIDLERTKGIPRNPFINAGALVVVDMLVTDCGGSDTVINFVREQIGEHPLSLNDDVMNEGGDLNRAMLSFMKHHGNVEAPIDEIMEAYAKQCAISVDCTGLALAGRFLTRTRLSETDEAEAERARRMRKVLALMMTCGHYDGSGDFAVRVGLPAKSGVGGGILAIASEHASIAVWSPNLDQNGNSILGVHALEKLGAKTGWSVFGPPLRSRS